jgi:hypothetical protein
MPITGKISCRRIPLPRFSLSLTVVSGRRYNGLFTLLWREMQQRRQNHAVWRVRGFGPGGGDGGGGL